MNFRDNGAQTTSFEYLLIGEVTHLDIHSLLGHIFPDMMGNSARCQRFIFNYLMMNKTFLLVEGSKIQFNAYVHENVTWIFSGSTSIITLISSNKSRPEHSSRQDKVTGVVQVVFVLILVCQKLKLHLEKKKYFQIENRCTVLRRHKI